MPHEADAILGMTVSSRLVKDSVIWAWTTNGKFSVKSAYRVAQKWLKSQNHKADRGSTSDNTRMRALWRLVWSLNCPNKLKQFMWHSCRNILPTKHRLKSRGVDIEVGCDYCGQCESVEHVLWGCKFAADVWGESRLKLPLLPYSTEEFLEVVWEIRNRKPEIDWELFVAMAWGLWNQRNTVRFGGQRKTAHRLCQVVEEYVKEFHHENPPPPLCKPSRPFSPSWKPPK